MEPRVDVAVVGAGFAGLAVAAVCADAGLRVAVLERRPGLAPEGVGLVLQPNGMGVLDALGVSGEVLAIGQTISTARQLDPSGRVRAEASYGWLPHPHPYIVVVERTAMIEVLARRRGSVAELRFGCAVTGLVREGDRVVGVQYADGDGAAQTLRAGCVVGADGGGSAVRAAMGARLRWRTGPDRFLVGFADGAPDDDAARLYCGPGWCDGVMPFRGRTYFFDHVVGASRSAVERGDVAAWREAYARRVPEGERIGASVESFDQLGFLSGRTHRAVPRVAPGVALVGDAAAAVHPHNGQGANLALEDALTLGRALVEHGAASDVALQRYAAERDPKSRRYVPWSIFIGRLFDGPNPAWRAMRTMGYAFARVKPIARRTTMQQAGLG